MLSLTNGAARFDETIDINLLLTALGASAFLNQAQGTTVSCHLCSSHQTIILQPELKFGLGDRRQKAVRDRRLSSGKKGSQISEHYLGGSNK